MPKQRWCWLCGSAIFLAAGAVLALTLVVKHEPTFYRNNRIPEGTERTTQANDFLRKFGQMMINVKTRQETWACDATEVEINSFFEEAFVRLGQAESLRKLGISAPTVSIDGDHLRLAFRYGEGWFSSVISYDLKVWLVPKEPNVIAVQILSARAGALPISSQSILAPLVEFAAKQDFEVTPFRHEGTPVVIIRLQPNQPTNPIWALTGLRFSAQEMSIRGKTLEPALALPPVKEMAPLTPGS